jgi:hypothetical protein
MVGHDMASDAEEPTGERPWVVVPKGRKALPGREEDVLGGILGVLGPAQAGVGVAKDALPVPVEKLSERIDVTSSGPLDQVFERRLAGLLLLLYR